MFKVCLLQQKGPLHKRAQEMSAVKKNFTGKNYLITTKGSCLLEKREKLLLVTEI